MSLFNIGLSGLNTAQNALTTVSHNLSNSTTPGYSRQNAIIASAGALYQGSGYYGQGVQTTSVTRSYSAFLTTQLNNAQSLSSQLSTYQTQISQIDNLLSNSTSSLSKVMQSFFSAVQGVANTPADPSARQNMISSAQTLAGQMRSTSDFFTQLQSGVNTQLKSSVTQVNDYTKQIATLNTQIAAATASGNGQPPNDLLDQRDQAVSSLSQLIGVKVVVQDGTSYNVSLSDGEPLVLGGTSYSMQAVTSSADPSRTVVAISRPGGGAMQLDDSTVSGGSIGGLLQFRSQTLDPAQNAIGQLSVVLGQTVNAQQALGIGLTGQQGTNLFQVGTPTVLTNANNTGNAQLNASVTDSSALTNSDYTLSFDGTNYTLVRASDKQTMATVAAAGATYPLSISADGVTMQLTAGMVSGDSFQVQPTRNAAASFNLIMTDPAGIAAAAPSRVDATSTNTGSGTASLSSVAPGYTMLAGPLTATYNGAGYTFTDATGAAVTPTSSSTSGSTTSYVINGQTFSFGGTPKTGDTFKLSSNVGGVSNNSNMLQMAALQNAKTIGGISSYNDAYAQLVNSVGSQANSLNVAATSQQSITTQIQTQQQSVSGVNVDEETVSLMQYQQLYQANAQVIQAANTMFQTLLGIAN